MTAEQQLREKLRKISALIDAAATVGERNAAAAAIERVKKSLAKNRENRAAYRDPVHAAGPLAAPPAFGAMPPIRPGALPLQAPTLYNRDASSSAIVS